MAVRKNRSDCTVGTFEKTRGLPAGTIRNSNGRDARISRIYRITEKIAENM